MATEDRLLHHDWDLYDTRHVVYRPKAIAAEALEDGYWRAYEDFYRWGSIFRSAATKPTTVGRLRHAGYAAGWKKFEPLWDQVIRAKRVSHALPILESILSGFGTIDDKTERSAGVPTPTPTTPPVESDGSPLLSDETPIVLSTKSA